MPTVQDRQVPQLTELTVPGANDEFPIYSATYSSLRRLSKLNLMSTPGPIGGSTPSSGAFTSLAVSVDPSVGTGVGNRDYNDDRYGTLVPTVTYNNSDVSITLTLSNLNGLYLIENASAVNVYLPSVTSDNIGVWIAFYKMGAGNLMIHAADSDVIEDSAAGGNVANTTAAQTWASIELFLGRETIWKFRQPPLGTWTTT